MIVVVVVVVEVAAVAVVVGRERLSGEGGNSTPLSRAISPERFDQGMRASERKTERKREREESRQKESEMDVKATEVNGGKMIDGDEREK